MFKVTFENGLSRIGRLILKRKIVKTPILWISYEFFNPPNLWKYVKIDGLLVNVHNIINTKNLLIRLKQVHDLRKVIGFKGSLMLDCGGVKFARRQETYDVKHILNLYPIIKPDIIVSADYPISPEKSLIENLQRKKKNARQPQRNCKRN